MNVCCRTVSIIPVFVLAVLLVFGPALAYAVSGNISLDSPVYESLEVLNSGGFLPTYLAGTRPLGWSEVYRLMEEARLRMKEGWEAGRDPSPRSLEAMRDLENKVLGRLEGSDPYSVSGVVKGAWFELIQLDGEPGPIPGIAASQHPLVYNNSGVDPDEGLTVSAAAEFEKITGPFAVQAFPRLTSGEQDRQLIQRGVAKLGWGKVELSLGKENLWWGQGRHGGLYLTNNASPLPMARVTNPSPVKLPWIFSVLGPLRYDFFLSRLEEGRAVPEPWLSGIRLDTRPHDRLEMGMTMIVMAGGEGRPAVDFGDLWSILFGENEIGGEDRSNKIAGIDFRVILPRVQLYGELGGEDEAGGWPSKTAMLVGLYAPGFFKEADLRIEYADLALTEEAAGAWYRHGAYTDGYTYDGRILGHHAGGDGRDLFAETTFRVGERGRGRVGVDFERRGIYFQPAVEEHLQFIAALEKVWRGQNGDWKIGLTAAVDQVKNRGYVSGEDGTDGLVKVNVGRGIR